MERAKQRRENRVKRILNGPERLWVLFDNRAAWREQKTKEIGPERHRLLLSASLRPVTEKKRIVMNG
jgi:hypothetical protein